MEICITYEVNRSSRGCLYYIVVPQCANYDDCDVDDDDDGNQRSKPETNGSTRPILSY